MNIAIVKYNAGNVCSITNALNRLGIEPVITDNAEYLSTADKIIFPGVGEASSAMQYLKAHHLDNLIRDLKQPLLGICLGMQLLCRFSEENNTDCLGIFDLNVKKFSSPLKIPQIGWNSIDNLSSELFKGIENDEYVYFVHSYYAEIGKNTIATTDYGITYSSALHKNNFYATQFHPEKSGIVGAKIIENFINL
ncbi:MAG: imidazole glycerol phosphate synthase subunit HisH [Paludibacteraceae bacterium]|nr:imidazole glycerol phosphate synthase subunit HisH [Paludibacteraceae bacterium]